MQKGDVLQRAPLAAVEGVAADQIEGAGDGGVAAIRHDQGDAVGHGPADAGKEVAGQIGAAPFAAAGVEIEGEEGIPDALGQVGAGEDADVEPGLCLAPLAPDSLSAV